MIKRIVFNVLLMAGLPAFADSSPPAEPQKPSFEILEYDVQGNTTLPAQRVEEAVYPFLGEHKTIDDVEHAREALEKAYHEAGFLTVFVSIPEQRVQEGLVKLDVTESKVGRLRVSGSHYYSLGEIKAKVPELEEGRVPNFNEVQTELAGLNRSPGRRITPVLRAGRVPGEIEAELKVDDKLPLHASIEVNDRYSRDTTRTRLSAAVRYDNLWQQDHSLNLNFQIAPERPSESKVLVATYIAPLESGNTLAAYAVSSNTDVTTVGGINSLGKGNIFGLRYVLPLWSRSNLIHSLTLGADYKDYKDAQRFLGQDNNLPITYLPFTLAYDLYLPREGGPTQISLSSIFSLRHVVNDPEEFAAKRTDAKANFFYLKADARQTWPLPGAANLSGRLSLQYAPDPLISNEQMAAGGADTVRGYPESAALGDRGLIGGLELRSPSLAGTWAPSLNELVLLGFAEGARLQYLKPSASQQSRFDLSSVGLGVRFRAWNQLSGELDYARALHDAGGVDAGDERVHFRLGAEW